MVTEEKTKVQVTLPRPHARQEEFVHSGKKRIIIRAGRRGGKTVGVAIRAVERFLQGRRQLYAAPTSEQVGKFWFEVTAALAPLLRAETIIVNGEEVTRPALFKKNESEQYIEVPGTEQRIKAKTAWNADTLRGDYADDLYLDEFQLMNEDTWEIVGAPMLLDNNGDAVFIYTPPSLRSTGVSKARDPRHAAKLFKSASLDKTGRWQAVHFPSHDNPHISKEALQELMQDMSKKSYRQEILAEDDELQLTWLVWGAFNETCKIPRFPIPTNWLIHSGHDFGPANPAALFFAQDPATGNFYAFKEYLPGGGSTATHVEVFKEVTEGYNVISRTGGSPQEEDSRSNYSSHGWPIAAPKIKHVKPQIDKVIGMMELNKIFIFEDMSNLLEEVYDCLWKRD
ncbi:hypothetical protein LCGC14_1253140, partial [marine sediment metagenome]